jgi:hypothetical protein
MSNDSLTSATVLIPLNVLRQIDEGTVDLAFRRWKRSRVRTGTKLRTAVGLVAVDDVSVVDVSDLDETDALRSGAASLEELRSMLERFGDGPVHRIVLRFDGPDPRIALRADVALSDDEMTAVLARLGRWEWARPTLELIAAHPAVRAPDLAASLGRETQPFKRDVRKLKELGLTESLEVGYRLSPRGRAVLDRF